MSSSLPHTISFLSSVLKLDNNNNSSNHSNHSSPISSSSTEPPTNNTHSQLIPTILDILADPDEDEKPDRLKSFLSNSATHLNLLPDQQLNQLILSLLHQHREDIHHKPLPSTLTRSSSQRITIAKSRFQPRSPHPSSTPSTPDFSARFLQQQQQQQPKSASIYNQPPPFSSSAIHPPHSLISQSKPIPPSLNLPPPEKLNASAVEFKPILSRTVSMPFESTAIKQNSSPYIPTPDSARLSAHQPPFLINSVPRSATSLIHHSPAVSPSPNSPYFPRNSRPATPEIPRDPWLKEDSSSSFVQHSSPRLQSRLAQIEQQQLDDPENLSLFLPFQATAISPLKSPLPTLVTESPRLRKNQEPSCPSALQWGLSPEMAEEMAQFTVWDQSDSDGSQPPAIVHHPPEEDEDDPLGRYWMSPYDELCAALAGTGVSEALIDQALGQTGFDTSKAIDWLLERHGIPTQPLVSSSTSVVGAGGGDPSLLSTVIDSSSHFRTSPSSAHSASSRDHSPAGKQTRSPAASRPASPRFIPANKSPSPTFQKRPFPNISNVKPFVPSSASSVSASVSADDPAFEPGPSHRVCRFYLQGCCLRSDCKFSHDVGKAICRFWLKGHCLKGESKCDFLHEIPDLTNEEQAQAQREEELEKAKTKPMIIRSFADEFPSLEESVSNSNKKKSQGTITASRLKPALLLPDRPITPSPSLLKLSQTYHEMTLEFGSRRKECFDRAKECFKRADGAGVKKWSKEGDEWNRRLTEEPRATAGLMITERNRLMKDAVREGVSDRLNKVDEGPDRMHRGKEMGGGICLGVVSASSNQTASASSVKERMEVLMDLHGLHPDDGVYYLEKFMMALKTEGFQGLAYILTSSTCPTFTSSSSPSSYESSSSSSESSESLSTNSDGLSEEPTSSGITSKESFSNKKNKLLGPGPLNVLDNLQQLDPSRVLKEDLQLEKAVKTWLDRKRFSWESSTPSSTPSNANSKSVTQPKSSTHTNTTSSRPGIVCIDPVRKL